MRSISSIALFAYVSAARTLPNTGGPFVRGTEVIMRKKNHGTASAAVPSKIRWGCDRAVADWCCCFNRHLAEPGGYWRSTEFPTFARGASESDPVVFFDSVTQKPLFVAPVGRPLSAFLEESDAHGWPRCVNQAVELEALLAPRACPQYSASIRLTVWQLPRRRGGVGECSGPSRWRNRLRGRHAPWSQHTGRQRLEVLHQLGERGGAAAHKTVGERGAGCPARALTVRGL